MAYEKLGGSVLDYAPCRHGSSKLLFRGPRKDYQAGFTALIGGSETYGRFVAQPFPEVLEMETGRQSVNFGCLNAGVDTFVNDETVIDAGQRAEVTVIQVMGAQNISNRFYSVHPRRNDRFVKASEMLRTVFPEVDFTNFHFNRHMLMHLHDISPARYGLVVDELRDAWIARMKTLITRIGGEIVLLWFAEQAPSDQVEAQPGPDEIGRVCDPLFVTASMLDALRPLVREIVIAPISAEARAEGTSQMTFNPLEEPQARGLPGALAHEQVAQRLAKVLSS